MPRVLQCVAAWGLLSKVRVMTSSTWLSLIERGAPGRGSSINPASRSSRNRLRHLPTVGSVTRSCWATRVLLRPEAQANTMRDRNANRCALLGRRTHCSNFKRSSSDKVTSFNGRPVRIVNLQLSEGFHPQTQLENRLFNEFLTQDTSPPRIA